MRWPGSAKGRYEVMVATDIAARGLDIAGVTHVINFDVPQHPEDYVHRIGRTGRAQKEGDAFTIFSAEDVNHVQAIERFIETTDPAGEAAGVQLFLHAAFRPEGRCEPGAAQSVGRALGQGLQLFVRQTAKVSRRGQAARSRSCFLRNVSN